VPAAAPAALAYLLLRVLPSRTCCCACCPRVPALPIERAAGRASSCARLTDKSMLRAERARAVLASPACLAPAAANVSLGGPAWEAGVPPPVITYLMAMNHEPVVNNGEVGGWGAGAGLWRVVCV
jgi:hypothetical protein